MLPHFNSKYDLLNDNGHISECICIRERKLLTWPSLWCNCIRRKPSIQSWHSLWCKKVISFVFNRQFLFHWYNNWVFSILSRWSQFWSMFSVFIQPESHRWPFPIGCCVLIILLLTFWIWLLPNNASGSTDFLFSHQNWNYRKYRMTKAHLMSYTSAGIKPPVDSPLWYETTTLIPMQSQHVFKFI